MQGGGQRRQEGPDLALVALRDPFRRPQEQVGDQIVPRVQREAQMLRRLSRQQVHRGEGSVGLGRGGELQEGVGVHDRTAQ